MQRVPGRGRFAGGAARIGLVVGLGLTLLSCRDFAKKLEALASSCSPEDSAKCDGKTFSRCRNGHLVATAICGGDKGCTVHDGQATCDESKGELGEMCDTDGGGACTHDGKSSLVCKDHELALVAACEGPKGCTLEGGKRYCDGSRGAVGAACSGDEGVCGLDGKSLLGCKGSALALDDECRGPKACYSAPDGKIHCDRSIANVGENCTKGAACTTDGKERLGCEKGRLVADGQCVGPKGCVVAGDKVICDGRRVDVGNSCDSEGGVCSLDSKRFLLCLPDAPDSSAPDASAKSATPSFHVALARTCTGPKGCYTGKDALLYCDAPEADVGAPCIGAPVCSTDHTSELVCESGKTKLKSQCNGKRGCWHDAAGRPVCDGAVAVP